MSKTIHGNDNDEVILGSVGVDTLYGNGGEDTLYGFGGDDFLYGGDEEDDLLGGAGNDELHGNKGNDHLKGGVWVAAAVRTSLSSPSRRDFSLDPVSCLCGFTQCLLCGLNLGVHSYGT